MIIAQFLDSKASNFRVQGVLISSAGHNVYLKLVAFVIIFLCGCPSSKVETMLPATKTEQVNKSETFTSKGTIAPDRRMELAIEAATAQRYDKSIEHLRELLIVEPENAKAKFLMARCLAGKSDVDNAIELLESIPIDDAEFGLPAVAQRAEYLSIAQRLPESVLAWRKVLEMNPDLSAAQSALAIDLYRQGRRVESGAELQKLAQIGVASEDQLRRLLCLTNPPPSRNELVVRARQNNSDSKNQSPSLNRAWTEINERRYRDALATLKSLPDPKLLQSLVLELWLHTELMDLESANALIAELPEEAQQFPAYWLATGTMTLAESSNVEGAVAAYERAMQLDPTRATIHDRLSSALLKQGNEMAAREVDERRFIIEGLSELVLAIGPGQPDDAAAAKSMVEDLTRLGRFDQAATWIARIRKRHPNAFGDAQDQIRSLRAIPLIKRRQIWIGGVDPKSLAEPEVYIGKPSAHREIPSRNGLPNPDGDIRFTENAAELGIKFSYKNAQSPKKRALRIFEQLGGGVAAIDYDRDGFADLYFGQAGVEPDQQPSEHSDKLFRNIGGKFVEATAEAGVAEFGFTLGVTYGDWNQDGFWDLYVGNFGVNRLLINQGDGTFVDRSDLLSDSAKMMSASVGMADVDSDGFPDLIEVNYADDENVFRPPPVNASGRPIVYLGPNKYQAGVDRILFGGDTDHAIHSKFRLLVEDDNTLDPNRANAATTPPRMGDAAQPGLGLLIGDLDGKIGLEVFVANDLRRNQFWKVRRIGATRVMRESATLTGLAASGQGKSTACMGIGAADFDRNGMTDLVVTNWFDEWSNLYLQRKAGLFVDAAPQFGLDVLSDHHVGFGMAAQDFDNDGWPDLVVGNGHVDDFSHENQPQEMPTQVLRNLGTNFKDASDTQTDGYFSIGHLTRCVISADLDHDGRQDVVATDLIHPAAVLTNASPLQHAWLQLELIGTESERSAVGTSVSIQGATPVLTQKLHATAGYMGRGESVLHFGLGDLDAQTVDVVVSWPNGKTTERSLPVNQRHILVENEF